MLEQLFLITYFNNIDVSGYSYRKLSCPHCAGEELKTGGPLTATMVVFEDFLTYKSGKVIKHIRKLILF